MADSKLDTGTILLSEPFMLDPNFKRSAVLITEYQGPKGTVGFILNKPLKMKIESLIASFPDFDSEVFFGGPVATDTIHFVHNVGDLIDDSVKIARGVFWGGDFEKLKILAEQKLIKPNNIKFFVGYSGWSPGQLEEEMSTGSWVLAESDPNYVFKSKPTDLWKAIMSRKGDAYGVIGQMPENPNYN